LTHMANLTRLTHRSHHSAKAATMAFAALVSLAAAAQASADQWTHTYSVTGQPQIVVRASDANVEIARGSSGQVYAEVITSNLRIPDDLRVSDSQNGDRVEIDVHNPHKVFSWFGSTHHSIRVILHVPGQASLDVQTGDGDISADSVSGDLRLDSGDGNLSAHQLSGRIRLHTGDGNMDASSLDGSLDADTGDGHLNVDGRFDGLSLKSGDGSIVVSVAQGSHPIGSWEVTTGDGSITVRLPATFAATLEAHTGDGHISLDFPIEVAGSLSGSNIHGQMNGGGPTITLRSGDGNIHVEKH
jgi:DUF4097 and DUF4098 domain-containing protein YvlB